ncbi:hypothetical protein DID88_002887 [Monilinia fructigena]|uniref:Uncharacterized protein n=1 Tax=Monilinia fructigena TaxID=38457 RepID=A0A395IPL3_9HELO|nr:hypothetical protein DID88_002887 [Monilinia fructigena]
MVPISEASYFPELGKCLKGEEVLISWETAFFALLNVQENGSQSTLEKFFKESKVLSLLSNPADAFPKSTPETKSEYDSKVSPINADRSSADYDFKKVSEDALWLSKTAQIDEVSALRIVVQEHQSRAYAQLLGKLSEEELASLQDAFGNKRSTNLLSAGSLISTQAEFAPSEEESQGNRRVRMLSIYLSERRFFWKVFTLIIQRPKLSRTGKTSLDEWYQGLHIEVTGRWKSVGASQHRMVELVGFIDEGLEKLFDEKGNGSGWILEGDGRAELEIEWGMRLKFLAQTLHFHGFSFVSKFKFLDDVGMLHPTLQAVALPLQTISAIITVAILNVDNCLTSLEKRLDLRPAGLAEDPNKPWLFNETAIVKIHEILIDAASAKYITAGPAVLAWSVILKHIKVRVSNQKRLQRRRYEGLGDDDEESDEALPAGLEAILAPDAYEDVLEKIKGTDELVDYLALSAVNESRMEDSNIWDFVDLRDVENGYEPMTYFVTDMDLVRVFWQSASARYPWEASPFQTLVRSLAYLHGHGETAHDSIFKLLDKRQTFTYPLPYQFADYETIQEEDNNNSIKLTRDLPMFESRGRGINRRHFWGNGNQGQALAVNGDLRIPAKTTGVVIVENDPKVVHLIHEYRGMRYFGKLLETYLVAGEDYDATTGMEVDSETVADIIGTFATGLLALTRSEKEKGPIQDEATEFFQTASSALSRNRDITLVISAIFETGVTEAIERI